MRLIVQFTHITDQDVIARVIIYRQVYILQYMYMLHNLNCTFYEQSLLLLPVLIRQDYIYMYALISADCKQMTLSAICEQTSFSQQADNTLRLQIHGVLGHFTVISSFM